MNLAFEKYPPSFPSFLLCFPFLRFPFQMSTPTLIGYAGCIYNPEAARFHETELMRYGFSPRCLSSMMRETGIVIGGGFATNVLMHEAGHKVQSLPDSADIDFYVYGCLPPPLPTDEAVVARMRTETRDTLLFNCPEYAKYESEVRMASIMRDKVLAQFNACVYGSGYAIVCGEPAEYEREKTTAGDVLFTSTSPVDYKVYFYSRQHKGTTQKLNLVLVNVPLFVAMTKVDIGITAGFITGSLTYHHAAPQDINARRVCWQQPAASHTPRQIARLEKYRLRYGIRPEYTFTIDEYIAAYDTLPENSQVTLTVSSVADVMTPVVKRRIRGMPQSIVVYKLHDDETRHTVVV